MNKQKKYLTVFFLSFFTFFSVGYRTLLSADLKIEDDFKTKLLADYSGIIHNRGWFSSLENDSLTIWTLNPNYTKIKITIQEVPPDGDYSFKIISEKEGSTSERTFNFTANDSFNYIKLKNRAIPYLLSLTSDLKKEKNANPYSASFAIGYHRTNQGMNIKPEKKQGVYLIKGDISYDPLGMITNSDVPLYPGNFLDSTYSISIDPYGNRIFGKMDETALKIDLLILGRNKNTSKNNTGTRHLYGLFTTMEYYRPYLKNTKVLWDENVYSDHMHIQFCYWETLAFRHDIYFTNNGRELFFSYKVGIGPGQNSSLTATGITPEEEPYLNDIFANNWYGLHGQRSRKQNYYYSMTVPLQFEFTADRYFNSKITFKYSFYYFQALMDIKACDFLNRAALSYGFYLTKNITIGPGYEFWHVKSIENKNRKSQHWHRLNLQMEIKF